METLTFGEVKAEEVKVFSISKDIPKSIFLIYIKINGEFQLIPTDIFLTKTLQKGQALTDFFNVQEKTIQYYYANAYYEAILKGEKLKEQLQEWYYEQQFDCLLSKELNENQTISTIVDECLVLFSSHLNLLSRCIDRKLNQYQYKTINELALKHEQELMILEVLKARLFLKAQ